MTVIHHNLEIASAETLRKAALLLREGQLVVFPTETVYGLGGNATNDKAMAAILSRIVPRLIH